MKKHFSSVILLAIVMALLLIPEAKTWLLRQGLRIGIFNASLNDTPGRIANFTFQDDAGNKYSIQKLKGKVVLVNFWASWCPPCRAELPSLQKLHQNFQQDTGIVFITINEDSDIGTARRYMQSQNLKLPSYKLLPGISDSLYSGTLPTTLVLDKYGRLRYRHEGLVNFDSSKFTKQLQQLVQE